MKRLPLNGASDKAKRVALDVCFGGGQRFSLLSHSVPASVVSSLGCLGWACWLILGGIDVFVSLYWCDLGGVQEGWYGDSVGHWTLLALFALWSKQDFTLPSG